MDLMIGKGEDYAGEDVLANFKRMSALCASLGVDPGRSAWDCAMFLSLLKIDRLCNLKRKRADPKNESVQDSYCDLMNYLDLSLACFTEEGK
jgi:hypothetical protein